jgi:hypothetical protein
MSNCGAFSNEFCIWKEVRITCSHGRLGVDGEDKSRLGEGQVVTFSPCQTCLSDGCLKKGGQVQANPARPRMASWPGVGFFVGWGEAFRLC